MILPENVFSDTLERYQDETTAEHALTTGAISGYFLIPPDYLQSGNITYITPSYNPLADDVNIRKLAPSNLMLGETRSANFLIMAPMILSYMFMILIFEAPN